MNTGIAAPHCWRIDPRSEVRYTAPMAHTKPSDLADLGPLLAELRTLPGLVEKKPGIFYRKGASFLHFHDKDGVRWADLKQGGLWVRVDVDFGASAAAQKKLLQAVRKALAE